MMGTYEPHSYTFAPGNVLTIRSVQREDVEPLMLLNQEVLSEGDTMVTLPEEMQVSSNQASIWLIRRVEHPCMLTLVAWCGDTLVGYLLFTGERLKRFEHTGSFSIAVKKEWRGMGIGTLLLQSLLDWVKAHPTLEKVNLDVFATNSGAIRLYRRLGFVEEGRFRKAVKLAPGLYVDLIRMARFVR